MKSKKSAKSNGSPATNKEFFGARIERATQSVSAAAMRARGKAKEREAEKPPKLYDIGNTVYVPYGTIPFNKSESQFTNALIVGVEWGGDNRNVQSPVWAYWVRDVSKSAGSPMYLVTEQKIADRISM